MVRREQGLGKTYPVADFLRENGEADQDKHAVRSSPVVELYEELEICLRNNPTNPMRKKSVM